MVHGQETSMNKYKPQAADEEGTNAQPKTLLDLASSVLLGWSRTVRLAVLVAFISVSAALVPLLITAINSSNPSSLDTAMAVITGLAAATSVSALFTAINLRREQSRIQRPAELIKLVAEIESAAREVTGSEAHDIEAMPRTIADIVPALLETGAWSVEDGQRFKQVMRIRNKAVHTPEDEPNRHELDSAIEAAHSLRKKLQKAETRR